VLGSIEALCYKYGEHQHTFLWIWVTITEEKDSYSVCVNWLALLTKANSFMKEMWKLLLNDIVDIYKLQVVKLRSLTLMT